MVPSRIRSAQPVVIRPRESDTSTGPMARARKTKAGTFHLTERQAEVLQTIRLFITAHGYGPTRAEIAKALNLKHQSAVDNHLHALSKKGWLSVTFGRERAIRLLREGAPLYEPEDFCRDSGKLGPHGQMDREPQWIQCAGLWEVLGTSPDFYMRVRGDAMDAAGLPDGAAIVALRRCHDTWSEQDAEIGDVVVARIESETVLAYYRRVDEQTVELTPHSTNKSHKPRRVDTRTDDVEIIGVVVGHMLAGPG